MKTKKKEERAAGSPCRLVWGGAGEDGGGVARPRVEEVTRSAGTGRSGDEVGPGGGGRPPGEGGKPRETREGGRPGRGRRARRSGRRRRVSDAAGGEEDRRPAARMKSGSTSPYSVTPSAAKLLSVGDEGGGRALL